MRKFEYVIEKVKNAEFKTHPFPHIEIDNLFTDEDFEKLVASDDILTGNFTCDDELFESLFAKNYRVIDFPGCTSDIEEYKSWHKSKSKSNKTNTSCEGFGVVLRLIEARSRVVKECMEFINSPEFIESIAEKFGIDAGDCNYDCGIQKYLDGYEISPHPDIRRKALTYMVNINSSPESESQDHHTHYLSFNPSRKYVQSYWEGNAKIDTCWVPWDWCETVKQQKKNNSMVIFSPNSSTMHGVKASYDHLNHQRTQLYGNLWFKESPADTLGTHWTDLDITHNSSGDRKLKVSDMVPYRVKKLFKSEIKKSDKSHAPRKY